MLISYLASPYRHKSPAIMYARYMAAARVAGHLIKQGWSVFAPIPMSVPIDTQLGRPQDPMSFWIKHDEPFIAACQILIVACLPGYKQSEGVKYEINSFLNANKPIAYYECDHLFNVYENELLSADDYVPSIPRAYIKGLLCGYTGSENDQSTG